MSSRSKCFCAFCKSPRNVYHKKHASFIEVALSFAAALALSFLIWQDLDPRAIIFFVTATALSELFIVFRWRLSIACIKCGFDPVLYKKNRQAAADRVKEFYRVRREDPLSAFSPPPRLTAIRRPDAPPPR